MQWRELKLVKGAENTAYKAQSWELGFSVDNSRLRADLIPLHSYLKGGCNKEGVHLFSQMTACEETVSSCTRGGLYFFMDRVVKLWNRQPMGVVEVFKRHMDTKGQGRDSIRQAHSWAWSWRSFPTFKLRVCLLFSQYKIVCEHTKSLLLPSWNYRFLKSNFNLSFGYHEDRGVKHLLKTTTLFLN